MEISLEALGNRDIGLNAAPFSYPIRVYTLRDT
jgi:hypothetical protein